ncbi:hypothetical protein ACE939_14375 [Aquimarina sp. W85]|uniref:hypothetical protein n=1 Tax=Aquimarina rhodophyticola TaxID=3342246 RepID=UPI00366C69F1
MSTAVKVYFISVGIIFVIGMGIIIQSFRPVRNVTHDEVLKMHGKVIRITEAPGMDIAISIEDDTHYYYINRGLLQIQIDELRNEILDTFVTLYPVRRWTIFTRDSNMGHIAKITKGDKVIYNEIIKNTDD